MKDVLITMVEKEMSPGQDIHGMIDIKYSGRFDSIVINSQIENSNDIFNYTDLNGKKNQLSLCKTFYIQRRYRDKEGVGIYCYYKTRSCK